MTKEEMDKYAYELMVKNNPEEAVKQLLLKDKENERLSKNQRYYKDGVFSLEYDKETMSDMIDDYKSRIDKAIEHIETHQLCYRTQYEEESCFDNHLLDILRGK